MKYRRFLDNFRSFNEIINLNKMGNRLFSKAMSAE